MDKKKTNWVWLKQWEPNDKEEPALALFRKNIELLAEPEKAVLRISADSRYKLFVNGKFAEMGPSRGDHQVWFLDEVDIMPYLNKGKNVLSVMVLRYPLEHSKGNHGIFRTEYPGLYTEGEIIDKNGNIYCLNADESWKGRKDKMYHIVSEAKTFAPLQIYERTKGDAELRGWLRSDYDDNNWEYVSEYEYMSMAVSPGNLLKRTIPYLYRKRGKFEKIMTIRQSDFSIPDWEALLKENIPLTIPPNTKEIVEITAGNEVTAYLHLAMKKGRNSNVLILQSESYVGEGFRGGFPVKDQRADWVNGHLEGFADQYQVNGFGNEHIAEEYEPFWFRTFRFVRLEIETKEEALTITKFDYTQTGYPLKVITDVETSDPQLKSIWDMSERTLKLCMHETYEDCPFYEQLQYAMDSRSQILYTYLVAADDRLARKCMDDFRRSQRYDGLLNCSYPSYGANVIPGFSIYYILMLYDHMMYFGDKDLLDDHMITVEGILKYFQRNLDSKGYVKKTGGLNGADRFWSFIDWTPEWDDTTGVPPAILQGPITMESLLYVMGLQHAAEIAEYLGKNELSDDYRKQAKQVQDAVRKCCAGRKHMLTDGPKTEQYSQHTQVFAILTDTYDIKTGKQILEETIKSKEEYSQCSVAMAFYLFRAMQKTGLYAYTKEYWKIWTRMLDKGAATCVENEVGERSECHAWGALILYELPAVVLGVRPARPGFEAVKIQPEAGYLKNAKGKVVTPKGVINVSWSMEGEMKIEYEVPKEIEVL